MPGRADKERCGEGGGGGRGIVDPNAHAHLHGPPSMAFGHDAAASIGLQPAAVAQQCEDEEPLRHFVGVVDGGDGCQTCRRPRVPARPGSNCRRGFRGRPTAGWGSGSPRATRRQRAAVLGEGGGVVGRLSVRG
jgi:hypothetical protein